MIDHEVVLLAVADVFDQVDPPPQHVAEAARAAFSTRAPDHELLPLLQGQPLTPVRAQALGGAAERWFAFADPAHLEVEVGARREPQGWTLAGQVSTPVDKLWVQTPTSLQPVDVDVLGRFDATVPAGPVRLKLLAAAGGRRVRTDWVTL
jgi:hypothetical protein